MMPPGHLATGYVVYTILSRVWYRAPPAGFAVLALALGTQFPDLVDKPLAYAVGVLPSGRSFAHSLLVAMPVCASLAVVADRYGQRRAAVAFAVGWFVHILFDVDGALLVGDFELATFLFWPILPGYPGPADSFAYHYGRHVPTLEMLRHSPIVALRVTGLWDDLQLAVLVFLVWLVDGAPGPGALRHGTVATVARVRRSVVN